MEFKEGLIEEILYLHYVEKRGFNFIFKKTRHPHKKIWDFVHHLESTLHPDEEIFIKSVDERITEGNPLYERVFSIESMKSLYGYHYGEDVKSKVICKECGSEFEIYTYRIRSNGNFCKPECNDIWMSKHQTGENNPHWQGKTYIVNCAYCGNPVEKEEWAIKDKDMSFCNKVCAAKYRESAYKGKDNPNWKGGPVTVYCSQCGEELQRPQDKINENGIYWCDKKCESLWKHKNWKGENSPAWQNGSSFLPYCKKFNRDFNFSAGKSPSSEVSTGWG